MPTRRDLMEMTPEEIRAYLLSQRRLIIVSNGPDGFPHPMPMNFIIDEQDRYLITTFRKSQKVKNFERDPKAALLVESGLAYDELKSVLAYANAEIIDDFDAVLDVVRKLGVKEEKPIDAGSEVAEQIRASMVKRVVVRFAPLRYVSWDHTKLGGNY